MLPTALFRLIVLFKRLRYYRFNLSLTLLSISSLSSLLSFILILKSKNKNNRKYIIDSKYVHDVAINKRVNKDIYDQNYFLFKNFTNSNFINQFSVILRILFSNNNKHWIQLFSQIILLVTRTYLSLLITKLDSQIVKDIISFNKYMFLKGLGYWFILALPSSLTNSLIKFNSRSLSLNFKKLLTNHIQHIYLNKNLTYYKIQNITKNKNNSKQSERTIVNNIDTIISNDITSFTTLLVSTFDNFTKPIIDLILFSIYLRDNLGSLTIISIFANYFFSFYLLKRFYPNLKRLTNFNLNLNNLYYNFNLNLISNNEEISFYQGSNKIEIFKNMKILDLILKNMKAYQFKIFNYNFFKNYLTKYIWSALGYFFSSIPILFSSTSKIPITSVTSTSTNMKNFIINKRLMLSLSDAGSRLMNSIKDFNKLTILTNRIFTLLLILYNSNYKHSSFNQVGTVQKNFNDGIRFENINIINPFTNPNSILMKNLNFQFLSTGNKTSNSLLVLNSNNNGGDLIKKIISQLMPIFNKNSLLSIPNKRLLMTLPKQTYFVKNGTLRDQIIYPINSYQFFNDFKLDDSIIKNILMELKLSYLLKENSLDSIKNWSTVLSGGEKQRLNFARLLFHKPHFVVLDDSTNAISIDMENYLFHLLHCYNFNFITISQRTSLIKFHDHILKIDKNTEKIENDEPELTWNLQTLGTEEAITTLDMEIEQLKDKLSNIDKWEQERIELKKNM